MEWEFSSTVAVWYYYHIVKILILADKNETSGLIQIKITNLKLVDLFILLSNKLRISKNILVLLLPLGTLRYYRQLFLLIRDKEGLEIICKVGVTIIHCALPSRFL